MEGCEEVMTECGCYDFGTELDCYKQALNYIRKHLTFEPNNACAVLAYVQDNFKCYTPEIVRPETPIVFPEITLPTPIEGGNNTLPDRDGPYREDDRKPIWWYHTDHLGSSTYLTDNFGRPSHYYETLPFGEMMVEHNQSANVPSGVGYDNKYKFNGKELDDATQMYYYGARYYDPRISIFVSVDPLAEKYLNMTPYNYVANNPVNAIDPDGRDFRMIMQRDSKGNITHITLQATVFLQGKGASQEMANKMNKAFGDKFSGYKTVNGVKVGLDVVYAYDKNNSRNSSNLRSGENIFNVRTDMASDKRSFVQGKAVGDTYFTGNTGEINTKSPNVTKTVIHETLHLLGLSDRYDDYEGNPLNLGRVTEPHSGFHNDIMGGGDEFSDIHYENIINFGKSLPREENDNGFQCKSSAKSRHFIKETKGVFLKKNVTLIMATPKKKSAENFVKDIRKNTRRIFTAEQKILIVMEALRAETSVAELCRKHSIAQSQFYAWNKEFLEAGKKRLSGDITREATSDEVSDLKKENARLKEMVADLVLRYDIVKKSLEILD